MKARKSMLCGLILIVIITVSGCAAGTQQKATKAVAPPSTSFSLPLKIEPIKTYSLVEEVQNTAHAKLFPTMVSKGPDVKRDDTEHYGDGCIRCHSAVRILDDENAVLDDFFAGGKYFGQTEGISCRVCHVFEGTELIGLRNSGWDSCGICHVNSSGDPKLGSEVHHPQYQMIKGVAIGDLSPTPSFKYANMDNFVCQDCHVTNSLKHDFMVPGVTITHDTEGVKRTETMMDYEKLQNLYKDESCIKCHADPKAAADKLKQKQDEIDKKLQELKVIYEEWSQKINTLDVKDPKVEAFKNGATFFTFVEADASKGAHNYKYAKKCLDKAESYWNKLK